MLGGLALLFSGCYTYTDVSIPDVAPGSTVRAQVTAAEADSTERIIGYRTRILDGVLLQRDSNELLLRVPTQTYTDAGGTERFHQELRLPPADILDIQVRRLNKARTLGLATAGVAALVFIVARAASGSGASISGTPPSGPIQNSRVPLH